MTKKAESAGKTRAPKSRSKPALAEAAPAEMLPKKIWHIENHQRGAASFNGRYVPFARARPPVSQMRLPWPRIDDPEECAG